MNYCNIPITITASHEHRLKTKTAYVPLVLRSSLMRHIHLTLAFPYSLTPLFVFITVHHSAFSVQINSCSATSARLNPIVRRHGLRFRFDLSASVEADLLAHIEMKRGMRASLNRLLC
jgi:hypothetical protein